MVCARAQSLKPRVRSYSGPRSAEDTWRDVVPCNDNVPEIIAPGRVPSKERSACPGIMPFNDLMKGTEQLLRQRHSEREGWRRGDKEQGNSMHPRMLNKGMLDWPGGVLPTELGGLPNQMKGERSVFNSCVLVLALDRCLLLLHVVSTWDNLHTMGD